ncbi:hypothetical protein LGN17_36215 [Burkholderia sp. AU30280]|uniref:hypothetical protein n=1 Tax=Burkholderia sp. AU30280 TaxID=2879628 RepID=UPI001CF33684|nr:hypothetical protein [Burkholderia sp. AU30280]MCA8277920.1 hypothetical protein [Burkholderia sp. AU30280]
MARMLAGQRFRGACVGWPHLRFITNVLKSVSDDRFDVPMAHITTRSFAAHHDDECTRDVDDPGVTARNDEPAAIRQRMVVD